MDVGKWKWAQYENHAEQEIREKKEGEYAKWQPTHNV